MATPGGGNDGNGGRRPQQNLQGLLKFCAETTQNEDTSIRNDRGVAPMTAENGETVSSSGTKSSRENQALPSEQTDCGQSFWSAMEQARSDQDKALNTLGLYRYKIPGDGNCMFRAVASQLKLKQDDYHPKLRQKAVAWMKDHAEELLAGCLLDSLEEVDETAKDGVWPSQAALIALANVLEVNIAIIQGGDQGNIDIQHVTPFETPVNKECKDGIILAYLYNKHYDGIMHEPRQPNPEYKQWILDCDERNKMSETLARNIERYGSSYGRKKEAESKNAETVPKKSDANDDRKFVSDATTGWASATLRKSPEPEVSKFRVTRHDPMDSLSSRTRELNVRSEPVSENVKPTVKVGSTSQTQIHVPVFHQNTATRSSRDEWTTLPRSTTTSHRQSGDYTAKPTVHVIPIQHGSLSSQYDTESKKYGSYHKDLSHPSYLHDDDRKSYYTGVSGSSSYNTAPPPRSTSFPTTERVIPIKLEDGRSTSRGYHGYEPNKYSTYSTHSIPSTRSYGHERGLADYSYATELPSSFDFDDDYDLLRNFRTPSAVEMRRRLDKAHELYRV